MESRLQLYNRMLATRDEMSDKDVIEFSEQIQRKVTLMEECRVARRIGLYSPYGNEVRTRMLFEEADRNRKELYYPRMDENGYLSYFRILDLDELEFDEDGKLQPSGKQSQLRDISTLEVLIAPGVVFDLAGRRIGLGKGFYDESLQCFSGVRVALAYEFQVVSELPRSSGASHAVDWIVTEKRLIKCT